MGQTSNPTLRYPDGTDRPRAVQIRNLAEDTHAAINVDRARMTANETVTSQSLTSIGPGFTALGGSHAPRIWRHGANRTVSGGLTWVNGGMPGQRRLLTLPITDTTSGPTIVGWAVFYRTGHEAVPAALEVDRSVLELRIVSDSYVAGVIAAGSGWTVRLQGSWIVP